jgi:U4/U6 small nuclear ribonucleoprotein PRP31
VPKNVQKKLMNYGSGGATNGLSSSLAFTPIQGIELANPTINKDATSGTDSVFSEMRGFRKVTAAGLQRQLKD